MGKLLLVVIVLVSILYCVVVVFLVMLLGIMVKEIFFCCRVSKVKFSCVVIGYSITNWGSGMLVKV